ncbi:MAG TPA: type II toxin-antitoxin system VapC family toxin [Terriglobales bacterium]|nr:type II toxin-antitoxin system VapC family toxin [Terriglobales bacterium]
MVLLDTNVVSELMRPESSRAVLKWFSRQPAQELYSSSISLAEIFYGIELLPGGKRRYDLLAGAERMFTKVLAGRVYAFEDEAAHAFARIASARRQAGRPIAELDAQIAAIAHVHGAVLATRNTADFEGCGIRLVNPWVD